MTNATETWRVIPGHPEYDVSDQGHVRSKQTGMRIKKQARGNGANEVLLYHNKKQYRLSVAKLVWIAFKGPVDGYARFEHLNGDPSDDRLENLKIKEAKKTEGKMKLTKEEFAAGLEAARNKEDAPGSIAAEIAADLKREKAISKRIETPETTSKAPDTPTITAKVETPEKPDRSVSYLVNYDPKTTHTSGTIHGPLDQIVKMLGTVGMEKALVTVTFGE